MVGISYPPLPDRQVIVRKVDGTSWLEDVYDRPAGYYLLNEFRCRPTSRVIAEYCVEQVAHDMLPGFDEASATASFQRQRRRAAELLPAVLYRLRIEGFHHGARESAAAIVALGRLANTADEPTAIVDFVAGRDTRAWARILREGDPTAEAPPATSGGDPHGLPAGFPAPPPPAKRPRR